MWEAWRRITTAADPYLDTLTVADLQQLPPNLRPTLRESVGTQLLRVTGHYWFHTGEVHAVRQMLGHPNLPDFVGDIGLKAPYRPETAHGDVVVAGTDGGS